MNALAVALLIPVAILKVIGSLLGLVMVPLCLLVKGGDFRGIFWLWGNDEEHYPEWWAKRDHPWWIRPWPRFWWFAIRNPFNNSRFIFEDVDLSWCEVSTNWDVSIPMEAPQMIEANQLVAWYFIRCGWKCGYRRVWINGLKKHGHPADTYSEAWIGWKLASGVPGLGFAMQLRIKRAVGS